MLALAVAVAGGLARRSEKFAFALSTMLHSDEEWDPAPCMTHVLLTGRAGRGGAAAAGASWAGADGRSATLGLRLASRAFWKHLPTWCPDFWQ